MGAKIGALGLVAFVIAATTFASVTNSTRFGGYNIEVQSTFGGYQSLVDRDYTYTTAFAAYDYSVNLLRTGEDTGERHRAFVGGRWKTQNNYTYDGDHILQFTSTNGSPNSWSMWSQAPEFWLGKEEGTNGLWWSENTMDAEVMLAHDGTWIMMVNCMIMDGDPIDLPGQTATSQADRILLLTSSDCKNWTKWTTRGVVTNISNATSTMLHHQELVYVPWDEDGKPYWLYFAVNTNDVMEATYRIRSSDYYTFDYTTKERMPAGSYQQIGNQIGYMEEAPGGPMFVRITFSTDQSTQRTVPSLEFSRNGLLWSNPADLQLEGSNDSVNSNCYFNGIATWLGRGGLEYMGGNQWKAKYAATTSGSSGQPDIWYSEIGVGELIIDMSEFADADLYCINRTGAKTDLHRSDRSSGSLGYDSFGLQIATLLGTVGNNWLFEMGDYNRDSIPDLYCFLPLNGNNKAELHILDGYSSYNLWILQKELPFGASTNWAVATGDYDDDGIQDLYCINRQGSNMTEVHVLDGAAAYTNWLLQTETILGKTDSSWQFEVGDYNGDHYMDVYSILTQTAGGYVEVRVMNGANNYTNNWLLQTATIKTDTNSEWEFELGDYNRDDQLDLYALFRRTDGDNAEVHVMDGSNNFTNTWLLHLDLGKEMDADWTFSVVK